jgi:hypothetical protein
MKNSPYFNRVHIGGDSGKSATRCRHNATVMPNCAQSSRWQI